MIAIINYNSGNIGSVTNALNRLKQDYCVTDDPKIILKADKVIFPGVGRASSAMQELKKRNLIETIKNIKVPFLGICLGMQLLLTCSEEDNTKCLNIIGGQVKKFSDKLDLKIPHIGWNSVDYNNKDLLFRNISENSYFYFVNSYYVETTPEYRLGNTNYGIDFTSAIKKDNFYGVQFHPEKSGDIGEKLLSNFINI